MLSHYEKIPVAIRWIIYIPIVLIASFIVLFVMGLIHNGIDINVVGNTILQLMMSMFTVITIVYFSYNLAPKYKYLCAIIFFILISVLQILAVVKVAQKTYYSYDTLVFQDGLDLVIVAIWFFVGFFYLRELKNVTS